MSEIPTYCVFIEFTGLKDVLQMLGDRAAAFVEQDADELLGEPDGLVLHANFDALFPGLCGEDEELRSAVANLNFFRFAHVVAPIFLRLLAKSGFCCRGSMAGRILTKVDVTGRMRNGELILDVG